MNRDSKSQPADKARELFVLADLGSMPSAELRALCGGFPQWISALLKHKVLRSKSPPTYALELLRISQCELTHVPKRLVKPMELVKKQLQKLGFAPSFYANIPALGPHSSALMGMSQEDGEIHFCRYQFARKTNGGVADGGHFGFFSWLRDGECLATFSGVNLPQMELKIKPQIVRSDDPAAVLKTHKNRLLKVNPQAVSSAQLYETIESDYQRQIADLRRRGVIRAASAAEVARIRSDMRV